MLKIIKRVILLSVALMILAVLFYFKVYICNGRICLEELGQQRIKNIARIFSKKVYQEATEHNPRGDWLPDWIDDAIKNKLKAEWRKEIEKKIY